MGMSTNESFLLHKKLVTKKLSTNESLSTNGSVTNGSLDCNWKTIIYSGQHIICMTEISQICDV